MPRNREREKALPVGLFVLLGVALLIIGALWIQGFVLRPKCTFTVVWQRADILSSGISVYFRGVQVGRVTQVELSPDSEHTLVRVGITYPDLKVPLSSRIFIRSEGFTGQRYLEIIPPVAQPNPRKYLADRDTLNGSESTTFNDIMAQVDRIIRSHKLDQVLEYSQEAMARFGRASQAVERLGRHGDQFLSRVEGPSQQTLKSFQQTSRSTQQTLALLNHAGISIQRAGDHADQTVMGVQQQLRQTQMIPNWANAAKQVSGSANSVESTSQTVQRQLQDSALIPNASLTFRSLSTVLNGSNSGGNGLSANQLEQLRQLLEQLDRSSGQLLQDVGLAQGQRHDPSLNNELVQFSNFASQTQTMAKTGKANLQVTGNMQQIRTKLALLQNMGNEISAKANRLQSALKAQMVSGLWPSQDMAKQLLMNLQALSSIGQQLSDYAQLQNPLNHQVSRPPGQTSGASTGLIGTMNQIQHTTAEYDCLSRQLNEILNSRFLGFRLFFGKLGHSRQCQTALSPYKNQLHN